MINNYKAQRNVRAELGGAVDLGEPVSLYIAENEVKYGAEVTQTGLKIKDIPVGTTWAKDATQYGWKASGNGFDESSPGTVVLDAEGGGSIKVFVPANTGTSTYMTIYQSGIVYKAGQQYEIRFMAKASEASRKIRLQTDITGANCPLSEGGSRSDLELTTDWAEYKLQWTATATGDPQDRIQIARDNDDSDVLIFYFNDVSVHEVIDHSYKLMAVNDSIPAQSVNTEAVGPDLFDANKGTFTNGSNQLRIGSEITSGSLNDNTWYEISAQNSVDFTAVGAPNNNVGTVFCLTTETASAPTMTSNDKVYEIDLSWITTHEATMHLDSNALAIVGGSGTTSPGQLLLSDAADLNQDLVVGRTYKVDFEIKMSSGSGRLKVINGDGVTTNGTTTTSTSFVEDSIIFTAGHATNAKLSASGVSTGETIIVDNITIKEVYGYDYYKAPAYKFGIVSSVYDQSTGAMKTSGVAGDEVDVTVQGECTLRKSGTYSLNAGRIIARIFQEPSLESFTASSSDGDYTLPNSFAVTSETTSSSNTQPIILWQGVEFSEHFVHKNSLQVMAKCDETITKFRPVSLFLDSEGGLLCRHDDIPEQTVDADTDYTGVDPGKWGVAELGGVSGELIPVTVAGKTTFKTDSSVPYRNAGDLITRLSEGGWLATTSNIAGFTPNALGTVMESGGAGDEVPITIFQGTPIGSITDWKRTIKVTAKANGTINDFTAVSLYLDQYGNYKCISDGIPNLQITVSNGIWVDFRKWGVAQNNASDGEDVEIIVQGRTRVRNSSQGANKGDFVRKIDSNGYVSGNNVIGNALSTLGIVEKEARIADGAYGVIIIF